MRLAAWCGVAGLVLLAAARAHADWRTTVSVKGRPNDLVEVWQPGNFSVGVGQGAHLFLDGGFSRTLDGGVEPAGTYYHASDDCFLSVRKDGAGTRNSSSADGGLCGAGTNPFDSITPIASNVRRVKHATDGGAVALVDEPPSTYVYLSDTSIYDTTDFTEVAGIDDSINGSLGVVRVDGKLYSLLGTSSPSSLVYWVDGSRMESWAPSEPMGAVWGIDLFPAGSPAFPYAVVGTQQGILQGSTSASGHQLKRVQGFDAGVGVTSVSMNVGAGSAAGQGFGMALVAQPDGGVAVASPVPMLDDTQAGTVWRFRPLPASVAAAPLKQVACTGASYCVFTADRTDTNNVFIYTNDAGPALSLEAPGAAVTGNAMDASVALDEGQTVTLTLSASDPEGDPVLVTASPLSVTSAQWSVVPAVGPLPGDPVVLSVTGGTLCQSQQVGSFSVSASDGLAAHDAHQAIQVSVNHSRPPEVPGVVLPDGGVVLPDGGLAAGEVVAGMSPLTLRVATDTTAAGCKLPQLQWTPMLMGPQWPSLAADGGTAVLTPPSTFCEADGGTFGVQLQVKDEGGLSNTATFNVHVAPWGRPNAVFSADSGVEVLTAGQSLELGPDGIPHDCADRSPLFPGVDTVWNVALPDGGVPGGGITFRDGADGGLPIPSFPARAERLVVETPDCIDTTPLVITAEHHLRTADALAGPSSEHPVRVQTALTPFDAGALLLEPDGTRVRVDSTLNCPARRDLRADLQLERTWGDGQTQSATVPIPGSWNVTLGEGCGRTWRLKGTMVDGAGRRSAELVTEVPTPRLDTALDALPVETALVARCGAKASVTLTQTFPPGACQAPDVTWTQVSGPLLEQASLSGATVSLVTRDTGLDALVGEAVVMRVTAGAGAGNETSLEYTLPITVEPFVKVRRRTEVPAASETGLVGVSVDLLNTTTCAVKGVSYVERLAGLTYVEGSAKFDGQPVEATWRDGALTVTELSLAGEGTGTLSYVARPHLMGERRMEGEARLRDVPISLREDPGPRVTDSGCGCTSSGPGPVLFALGALGAAVRRRRR